MKLPPIEKVYEAWSAIADGRVTLHNDGATVTSSDGTKQYTVKNHGNEYSSTDNATFWQGYPGYPVIAYLMLTGRVPLDKSQVQQWGNINWTTLNKEYRRNYDKAVASIAAKRGIDATKAAVSAQKAIEALQDLPITIKRKINT